MAKALSVPHSLVTAVVLLGIVVCLFPGRGIRRETSEAAVIRQVNAAYDRMIASAESRDVEALLRDVLDNDQGALALNGRLYLTRDDACEQTRRNFQGVAVVKYAIDSRHVTMLSPSTALLVATGKSTVRLDDGREVGGAFVHTVVYRREAGEWRALHSHQSTPR